MSNLLTQGDMEVGAGNPYIPNGWANVGLAAGESAAEAAIVHAGAQSIRFAAAAAGDGFRQQITAAIGDFIEVALWSYGDGNAGFTIGGLDATQVHVQAQPATFAISTPHTAYWSVTRAVFRVVSANPFVYVLADAGAVGNRYIDDVSALTINDVSLTCTPANAAASLESGGIRIDGRDTGVQNIPAHSLFAKEGWIRWKMRPRHADGNYRAFEEAATPFVVWFSAPVANYITVDCSAAGTLRLEIFEGGAASNGTVVGPGLVADTEYLFEIRYTGTWIRLLVDGAVQIQVNPAGGIDFLADIPTAAYWGSRPGGDLQVDAVFLDP